MVLINRYVIIVPAFMSTFVSVCGLYTVRDRRESLKCQQCVFCNTIIVVDPQRLLTYIYIIQSIGIPLLNYVDTRVIIIIYRRNLRKYDIIIIIYRFLRIIFLIFSTEFTSNIMLVGMSDSPRRGIFSILWLLNCESIYVHSTLPSLEL